MQDSEKHPLAVVLSWPCWCRRRQTAKTWMFPRTRWVLQWDLLQVNVCTMVHAPLYRFLSGMGESVEHYCIWTFWHILWRCQYERRERGLFPRRKECNHTYRFFTASGRKFKNRIRCARIDCAILTWRDPSAGLLPIVGAFGFSHGSRIRFPTCCVSILKDLDFRSCVQSRLMGVQEVRLEGMSSSEEKYGVGCLGSITTTLYPDETDRTRSLI